ncbi:MAG: hypothetical protein J5570_09165 [Lachnospiraceae bacterium]|nr:hypothetical protein [Lachnospiraceae bacterium]
MSESYVECLVKGRPNTKAKALMILFIVLAAAAFVAMFVLGGKWWLFIFVIGFGVGIYFSSQYTSVEYEYLYVDKELVVDKIFNQSSRKRVATYSLEKVQIIAPVGSRHLDNFGKLSTNPKDYSSADKDLQDVKYVMIYEGQEQVLFSPNEALVKIMKNAAPRKVYSE